MRMRAPLLVALAGLAALVFAGPHGIGALALRAGLPGIALPLLSDPAARGVALYQRGDYADADRAFADAGRSQTYNRGLSLAGTGEYALSVAYFDAMLFANPADNDARQNRLLVLSMIDPVTSEQTTPGRISGVGGIDTQDRIEGRTGANAAGEAWDQRVLSRGIAASDAWLATISDDPGEFLRLRLAAEYERRAQMGLIRPEEADPW